LFAAIPRVRTIPAAYGPRTSGLHGIGLVMAMLRDTADVIVSTVRLTRRIRADGIAIVHCTEKARETMVGFVVARLANARLVVHLHVGVDDWFSRPTKWVMHRADLLLAISEFVGRTAAEMGYDPSRIAVALNGMSPPTSAAVRTSDVRTELGLAPDAQIVLIVARLNPWKGHVALYEAFGRVVEARGAGSPDVVLLVVGTDATPNNDGPWARDLRAAPAQFGIADRVRFLGLRSDVGRLMESSDVFAMPSMEEPFGLVFLEAMAAGIPVLGERSGGTLEVVVDGVTGLLAEPGDVAGLAANLRHLLDDPDLCRRLGAAGRQHVAEHFSADRMAADVAAVYDALLAGAFG
jgi:glycosyltransferase involved in cell wall biosynthesis